MSIKPLIQTHLPEFEERMTEFLFKYKAPASLSMCSYHLGTGGKRLRGLIPLFVYEYLGKDPSTVVPIGMAIELTHNATLVHDDLQDGDEIRRNKPTVWKKYGSAQAINCGDAFFQYAFLALSELEAPATIHAAIHKQLALSTLLIIEGQAQEFMMKEEPHPNIQRYMDVIDGKTAGLFSLPISTALLAAEIKETQIAHVEVFSKKLGKLFQIQDDLLDLYGNKGRGQVGTDIAEGKVSFLVSHVYETANTVDCEVLRSIIKKSREQTTQQDIHTALELFEKYKSKEAALEIIRSIQNEIKNTHDLNSLSEMRNLLVNLCDLFLEPIHAII